MVTTILMLIPWIGFAYSWILYKWNHPASTLVGLVSFTQHYVFRIVHVVLWSCISLLRSCIVHYERVLRCICPSTIDRRLSYSLFCSYETVNTIARVSGCTPLHFCWVPRRGIAGSSGVGLLYFNRYYKKIFRSGFSKPYSTRSVWKFQVLWICPDAYVVWFSYFNYSDDCPPGNLMVKVSIH